VEFGKVKMMKKRFLPMDSMVRKKEKNEKNVIEVKRTKRSPKSSIISNINYVA
jgi:hypothetical protein